MRRDYNRAIDLDYGIPPPGFRLPAATHIGVVRLQVSELARSIEYYTRMIGFRVQAQTATAAILGARDDSTPLLELHERRGVRPVPRRGLLGLYHFAILVPDRAGLGRFVAHLAASDCDAGSADHWVSEALYLTDPDGLGIEVYADRPRSTWQVNGRELAMSTEPLDLGALARAGGGERWTGLPAGTVIGHVHLYVGDLTSAEAFYHSALGFDKTVWSYPGALFMSAGGYHHHLGTNTWAQGARPATDADARLLEWELVLPNEPAIADAMRSMTAAGYPARDADDQLIDPWGTPVRLTPQREPRKE